MPRCAKAKVRINTIHVLESSVTTTAEPGSNAEWFMSFNVNGEVGKWSSEEVVDDTSFPVGREFIVPLEEHTEVIIRASGYEEDDTSANDPLPSLEHKAIPADEWEIGGTYTTGVAESAEGSYKLDYTVSCAEEGQALSVPREYVGAFRTGQDGHGLWSATWDNFRTKWEEWSKAGLRLTRLSTFKRDTKEWTFGSGSERIFVGTFRAGSGGHALWLAEWPSFEAKWKELSASGLRLIDIAPYEHNGSRRFAGVYGPGNDGHALWVAPWPSFEAKWKELSTSGLRLVSLDTYVQGGTRYFTGAFRAGTDPYALWVGAAWESFRKKWLEFSKQGLRLVDIASYPEGSNQLFAGVWRSGQDNQELIRGTWSEFVEAWKAQGDGQGRLVGLESFLPGTEE